MWFLIYCDESEDKGEFYSNFYGGALVKSSDRQRVEAVLEEAKGDLAGHEFKWTKVKPDNEARYIEFARALFGLIHDGSIKLRIMFTQNINQPSQDAEHDEENRYFLLYYQFLKHAFGLQHRNEHEDEDIFVAVYLDEVAHKNEKFDVFKDYLSGLTKFPPFRYSGVSIPKDTIASVDSRDHVILQAVDVIL